MHPPLPDIQWLLSYGKKSVKKLGSSLPKFSPKLEPIHKTKYKLVH